MTTTTTTTTTPMIPVSVGELIDKITILEIKRIHLTNLAALENVRREHELLTAAWAAVAETMSQESAGDIQDLRHELRAVNQELWHIEDFKRAAEQSQDFGPEFISAARSVYIKNDHRAGLKRTINSIACSTIREEKSHTNISHPEHT